MNRKYIFCLLFLLLIIQVKHVSADEESISLEDIRLFSEEELEEEEVDTTKINVVLIDQSMLDETYIIAGQTKDIVEAKEKRKLLWIAQLSGEDPELKKDAIVVLGKLKEKQAIPDLLTLVKNPNEQNFIRSQAAWALSNMGQDILPELEKITKEKDLKTRVYGIWALGMTKNKTVVPILKKLNEATSPEDKVTKKAILNIMKIFDTSLLRPENW